MVLSDAAQDLDSSRVENIPDVEIMILLVNSRADLYPHQPSITFLTILNQPYSMGTIDISSADHRDRPNICLQTRSDPRDKDVARTALRFALRLAEQFVADEEYPHPSSILAWPGAASSYPGWDKVSDEDADDYIEKRINSNHHLTSSCRMARREHGGVVDDELRIHGLKNVRIADASVLPQVPPAHPMAAVYMVAERCAEFAKAARGKAY